jgi:hypothetical protein
MLCLRLTLVLLLLLLLLLQLLVLRSSHLLLLMCLLGYHGTIVRPVLLLRLQTVSCVTVNPLGHVRSVTAAAKV